MQSSVVFKRRTTLFCKRFSLSDIRMATDEFGHRNLLGEGAFGKVYRGNISGKEVAIKRMIMKNTEQGILSFRKEIDLLSACDQVNVISLIGYCDEGAEKILVYELMPNGSLYDYIHSPIDRIPRLTMEQRLTICIGVAEGVRYLHSGTDYNIIHSDLKTDNILLDLNLVPKISDFGLSRTRVAGPSTSLQVTNKLQGTDGYIAPECYEPNYKLSRKADVYAFGVVLLEVLCERPTWKRLVMLALPYVMRGELHRFIPEHLERNISLECSRVCENLIRDCLENDPDKRPIISQVVDRLNLALKLQEKQNQDSKAGEPISQQVGLSSQIPLTIPKVLSSGKDLVVLYHTSSGVIKNTQDLCQEARQILDGYGKRVDERDLYLDPSYREQLRQIFGASRYTLPQLFIGGKYVGGADEIRKLHWNGKLKKQLDRLPKRDYPSFCHSCSNTRIVYTSRCPSCCFWKND